MKGQVEKMATPQAGPGARERLLSIASGTTSGTVAAIALILIAWHIGSFFTPEYILPSISQVLEKLIATLADPRTYQAIGQTLQRVLGGFFLSALVGIAIGVGMAMSRGAHSLGMPLVKIISGVPALTWVLLAIIWFQSAELRVWFIMFILVFPIVAINTYDGVRSVPADLYQMVQALRPSRLAFLRLLIIPSAMPFIFSGLKVSLSFGGRIAVFAEALSASTGIGAAMYIMNQLFDTAGIIVWTILLIVVLTGLDLILTVIENRWFRWRAEVNQ